MGDHITGMWHSSSLWFVGAGYKLFIAVIVFVCAMIIAKLVKNAVHRIQLHVLKVNETLIPFFSGLVSYSIYGIGIIIILDIFGINTTSLIAVLGASALAIGMGLRNTLQNIASGIILLVLSPFKVQDKISCGGVAGTVEGITLFSTVLKTGNGEYICAPNSSLWGPPIINYTRNSTRRLDLDLGIAPGSAIEPAVAMLKDMCAAIPGILSDPGPEVVIESVTGGAVTLILRIWVPYGEYSRIREALLARLAAVIPADQNAPVITSVSAA